MQEEAVIRLLEAFTYRQNCRTIDEAFKPFDTMLLRSMVASPHIKHYSEMKLTAGHTRNDSPFSDHDTAKSTCIVIMRW